MSKPSWFNAKKLLELKNDVRRIEIIVKKSNLLFFAISLIIFAGLIRLWDSQTVSYAHAYASEDLTVKTQKLPIVKKEKLFADISSQDDQIFDIRNELGKQIEADGGIQSGEFAQKIYEMVGDTPIREMVPFISQRDEKVAAFLIGIAKKESSFGLASPSKDGQTCYNYWGYKGSAGRGTGMGYACFASPEEAIQIVGDRIEVLVNKERNTPARMVDTWKCGRSCAGDPGAPSWVATVALYFDKLVG